MLTSESEIRPLRLHGHNVCTVKDLAKCIIDESDDQMRRTPQTNVDQREDFQMCCDGLNLWRMCLRLKEEGLENQLNQFRKVLSAYVCQTRGYSTEEFNFALEATKNRPRSAFGMGPLEQAYARIQRAGFRLLIPELKDSVIATEIAGIAWQLQKDLGNSNILLPVEQLRTILGRRKIVISGAIHCLVDCEVIRMAEERYHTRRAREYRFTGEPQKHFEFASE